MGQGAVNHSSYSNTADAVAERLVGRERELAALEAQLLGALNGSGSLVLVSGEAGIGKTSLIQALAPTLRNQRALVLEGGCYDLSMTPPYGPWFDAMRRYEPTDDLPPLPSYVAGRDSADIFQSQDVLFSGFLDFLTEVAARVPLVLVLEDLHWSDKASLDLLRFVARHIQNHRVLLAATYRDDEVTREHPLFLLLPNFVRESRAVRIELRRLSEGDIRRYVLHRYPLTYAELDRLARYLSERSEGNPLYVQEILRELEFDGSLSPDEEQWNLGDLERVFVPNLIQQMIEGRLAKAESATKAAIQAAAVVGQVVPLKMWKQLTDTSAFEHILSLALATGLLRYVPGTGEVRFSHSLVRQAVYDRIGLSERGHIHFKVAEEYLRHTEPDPDVVAHHLKEAFDPRLVDWLIRAGEQAERHYAHYEAFERYREALEVMRERSANGPELAAMLVKVGRAANLLDPKLSNEYLYLAHETATACGDGAVAAVASYFLGVNHFIVGNTLRGLQYVQQGINALAAEPAFVERVTHLSPAILPNRVDNHPVEGFTGVLAECMAVCGMFDDAVNTAERYLNPRWRDLSDHTPLQRLAASTDYNVHAYEGLGVALSALGDAILGRRAFGIAREMFVEQDPYHLVTASYELVVNHFPFHTANLSERDRLTTIIEEQRARSTRVLADQESTWGYEYLLLNTGRWDEFRRLIDTQPLPELFDCRSVSVSARSKLSWHEGNLDRAWEQLSALLNEGPRTEPEGKAHLLPGDAHRIAAGMAIESGDYVLARQWMSAHDEWLDFSGAILGRAEGSLCWAQIYAGEGDLSTAQTFARAAVEEATDPPQPIALIKIHRFLGELAMANGEFDAAETHLRTSLDLAEDCQLPFERLQTLLRMAELRRSMGQLQSALILLENVRDGGTELGARPTLARAEQLMNSIHEPHPEVEYDLTPREFEVLTLLAQGLSDRQIAERLFISHRTIMRHVSSILQKLDVDSRTAAAARYLRDRVS